MDFRLIARNLLLFVTVFLLSSEWVFATLLRPAAAGAVTGRVTVKGIRDARDVVVYFDRIPGKTFAPPGRPLVLDQVNLTFVPHVIPVLVGTTVAFPNSDEVRHNVFSPGRASKFNLGTYPRGATKYKIFDKPGEVTLLCNVHAEMSAFVIVTETPYFAVTHTSGNFTINDIPPGTYVVKTWHEKLKAQSRQIEIKGDETVRLDLELSR